MKAPSQQRNADTSPMQTATSTLHLRPQPRIIQSHRSRLSAREFSSSTPKYIPPKDITAGFPTPEPGSGIVPDLNKNEGFLDDEVEVDPPTAPRPSLKDVREAAKKVEQRLQNASATKDASPIESESRQTPSQETSSEQPLKPLVPPNVLAAYRTPLRHPMTHGIPVASLQLRSYSVRNLEFYADFAVRAAYYLGLPCTGPAPLPRRTERWTLLRSNFVNKKAQENFERITLKRLITVFDGEPSVVEVWLAFLRKWQFYGVGMKANVWQFEGIDVAGKMDQEFISLENELDDKLRLFGFNKHDGQRNDLGRLMDNQGHRHVGMGMTEVREKSRVYGDPY
ncbi:ribosomal protein S10 [Rhinocladiella mackenziei CBS 650.93]|uniref:Small ribosomal subunit protein uS10m n=1 Tax=Rhinocladiella mackenziei CBS 650.93 TaxID=1442369 RepID=A0A0D2IWH8_9EURO|nr:ribosomal protein S10 [Rhinocladiella mackenziei CBS 650.93]KIX10359.1 ribosomal protein S10 [Rhinocladiella mackenziei CBS 650.93]